MTPEYVIRQSLSRPPFCGDYTEAQRLSEIETMQYAKEYAEPGYTQPEKGILFANWNYFPRGLDRILENYGYEIEWSDEWTTCEGCQKAVRTSPDSYSYQPSYGIVSDSTILCTACLIKEADEYLETLEDNPRTALNISAIDPAEYGYRQLKSGFESGHHPGMTDDPQKIHAELKAKGKTRLLFRVDEVSQFYSTFSVWEKKPEIDCDQCEAAMIQGTFCHETGCPNMHSRYDDQEQRWIKQRKCFECGCTVDADDPCCNTEPE